MPSQWRKNCHSPSARPSATPTPRGSTRLTGSAKGIHMMPSNVCASRVTVFNKATLPLVEHVKLSVLGDPHWLGRLPGSMLSQDGAQDTGPAAAPAAADRQQKNNKLHTLMLTHDVTTDKQLTYSHAHPQFHIQKSYTPNAHPSPTTPASHTLSC